MQPNWIFILGYYCLVFGLLSNALPTSDQGQTQDDQEIRDLISEDLWRRPTEKPSKGESTRSPIPVTSSWDQEDESGAYSDQGFPCGGGAVFYFDSSDGRVPENDDASDEFLDDFDSVWNEDWINDRPHRPHRPGRGRRPRPSPWHQMFHGDV
ncbi:hypothetical protein EG68_06947 [Paragonimus skrjabini miyazakii]|uniref:Uncharacterized protein n=1 Tax=Paragonimus skrjabini miyazakii TaxID=59628 RepID=A0A8S9YLU4_9TREM|nr:hypothetical protein EG68_06947 [Paragonimus skrjabini miyazakii]